MTPFTLKGVIKLVDRRLVVDGDECYGVTEAEGQRFKIRLSGKNIETADDFLTTLLHEVMHLWIFVAMEALGFKMSTAASHRIIDVVVPFAMEQFYREYNHKRKRK